MELVRDIRDYPWQRILATVCIALPLATAIHFYPDGHASQASGSIAIWLDTTLRITALSLSFYRIVVTQRNARHFENAFQWIAIFLPSVLGRSSIFDPDAGRSVLQMLLADRGADWSVVAIAVTLCFVGYARFRTDPPR